MKKIFKNVLLVFLVLGTGIMTKSCSDDDEIALTDIKVTPTTISLMETDSKKLNVVFIPENAVDKTLTWKSMNEDVVTVVEGTALAHSIGETSIVVTTNNGIEKTVNVVVTEKIIGVTSVLIEGGDMTLNAGDTHDISAKVLPEDATNKSLSWASSDNSVAMVLGGKVVTYKPGVVTISAIAHNDVSGSIKLTVNEANDLVLPEMIGDWKPQRIEYWSPMEVLNEEQIKALYTDLDDTQKAEKITKLKGAKKFNLTAGNKLTMTIMLEDGTFMDLVGELTSRDENNNIRASFDVSAAKDKSFYGLDDITDIEQLDMIYDGEFIAIQHLFPDFDYEYDLITYFKVFR